MKYEVTFSCGHTSTVDLVGKGEDRKRKIKWYEDFGDCPECYKKNREAEKASGCREVEMTYADYKAKFADLDTKANSYDKQKKTIIVYVPEEETHDEIVVGRVEVRNAENCRFEAVTATFTTEGENAYAVFSIPERTLCRVELKFKAEKTAAEIVSGHDDAEYEKVARTLIKNVNNGRYRYIKKSPFACYR